jgi:hypothetical protein
MPGNENIDSLVVVDEEPDEIYSPERKEAKITIKTSVLEGRDGTKHTKTTIGESLAFTFDRGSVTDNRDNRRAKNENLKKTVQDQPRNNIHEIESMAK